MRKRKFFKPREFQFYDLNKIKQYLDNADENNNKIFT